MQVRRKRVGQAQLGACKSDRGSAGTEPEDEFIPVDADQSDFVLFGVLHAVDRRKSGRWLARGESHLDRRAFQQIRSCPLGVSR